MLQSATLRGSPVEEPHSLFRALGDPTRIRIVNLLAAGELCVCDVVELLSLPQPTISRHLALLRSTGLVRTRRLGRFMHYRLANPGTELHATLLGALQRDLDSQTLSAERSEAEARVAERQRAPC